MSQFSFVLTLDNNTLIHSKFKELITLLDELKIDYEVPEEIELPDTHYDTGLNGENFRNIVFDVLNKDISNELILNKLILKNLQFSCEAILMDEDINSLEKLKYILDKISPEIIDKYSLQDIVEKLDKHINCIKFIF